MNLSNEHLDTVADRVIFDGSMNIIRVYNDMQDYRFANSLPWITAQQLGLPYQIMVVGGIDVPIVNPNIITYSEDEINMEEMNASNGMVFKVKRPSSIRVRYFDHEGKAIMKDYTGMTARVIQQGVDLMKGRGLYSHVSKLKYDMALKRKKKMERKYG